MTDNIEFFRNISQSVNPHAEEVTIVSTGVEENLFDTTDVPEEYLMRFFDEIGTRFGEAIDLNKLTEFSFQPADGVKYKEHKFMAVFDGGKQDCFGLSPHVTNPHDEYCVNYFIDSKQKAVKFYDLDYHKYTQPNLPEGAEIVTHWGQGANDDKTICDVYFLHPDVDEVAKFTNMPKPYLSSISNFIEDKTFNKVFGLTYDASTLQPFKLKLYYYPKDPNMEFTVFDEVANEDHSS
jgi:hypothetical protein